MMAGRPSFTRGHKGEAVVEEDGGGKREEVAVLQGRGNGAREAGAGTRSGSWSFWAMWERGDRYRCGRDAIDRQI
jgi:hypothetical protein